MKERKKQANGVCVCGWLGEKIKLEESFVCVCVCVCVSVHDCRESITRKGGDQNTKQWKIFFLKGEGVCAGSMGEKK